MATSAALTDRAADDALPDLDAARAHVAASALRPAPTGQIGLELEAHLVDRASPGSRVPWHRVTAAVATLPPLGGGSRVTLEPGGQVELSGPPAPDVTAAVAGLRADVAAVRSRLAAVGLGLAPVGTDPCRPPRRLSPGPRYVAMEEHFQAVGQRAAGVAMMASTAALQVNLEAGPPTGWAARVRLAHALGPVLVAVSACSPLVAGAETNWRSSRQRIWSQLDPGRCGPLRTGSDPADAWAAFALAAPVMLVRGPAGSAVPVRGRTSFAAWVGGAGPTDRRPTLADLDYHLTTLFPPVRLRGYLELRYLDAAPEPWWPALAAVVSTLLDDPVAADVATAATEPVAGRWEQAARAGLADRRLHTAASLCMEVAARRAPAALRAHVTTLAELVERRASPGDAVLQTARTSGAAAALLAATHDPEEGT